ncbi:MAG TPA: dihydrolipoamide acetyltransferase family protein [Chthonomonadales bacterium]|nr:dihydrolipoamide acetyltransferase family protein [Chthonomonadales bacterium]
MATEVLMPPLGTNVDTATLVIWYRREGDQVAAGEALFAVETDKATLDVEAPATGVLRAVSVAAGEEAPALTRIAWIATADENLPEDGTECTQGAARHAAQADAASDAQESATAAADRRFASPRARRAASEMGVDLRAVAGTGPSGSVVERDVLAAARTQERVPPATPLARRVAADAGVPLEALAGTGPGGRIQRGDVERAPAPAPGEAVESVPVTGVRAHIAERLGRSSRETAAVTLTAEADATAFARLRGEIVAEGLRASYNDLFLRLLARALREHPRLNASLVGDRIVALRRVDIALAVDTERGLLAPVLRGVDDLSLREIVKRSAALVDRARRGECPPEELSGGTFTLTNLGMYGIDAFTPIVNLPECAILGVGRIKQAPAVVDGRIEVRHRVWLSLTFDHRIVDGGPAARFLQRVVQLVEEPGRLLAGAPAGP